MRKIFPDSEIVQTIKIKKTKASYVMQEGITWEEVESVSSICRDNKFSIIIDESTDISVSQILAIVVRFYHNRKVTDALLAAIEVEDSSAESMYATVKGLLQEKSIPLKNIVGFGSDNCSVMMGATTGFQTRLKADVPGVFVLGCVCHSFALCANHASKHLPSWLESFVKDVCCYFARSSKRQHQFRLIQDVVDAPRHRVLKLSQTRWLSRGQVIARILEQWEALALFFQSESPSDRVDGAAKIYQTMRTAGTKHMLLFLNYILTKVDKLNIEFQSTHFKLHTLYSTISDEYRSILAMFIQDNVIKTRPVSEIDPNNAELYKPIKELHLGGRCLAMCAREPLADQEQRFRQDCRTFLIQLCNEMKKRFTLQSDCVLAMLSALDPKEALSTDRSLPSIIPLAVHFPSLVSEENLHELDDQWQEHE